MKDVIAEPQHRYSNCLNIVYSTYFMLYWLKFSRIPPRYASSGLSLRTFSKSSLEQVLAFMIRVIDSNRLINP